MQQIKYLLCALVVTTVVEAMIEWQLIGTKQERQEILKDAISEAKLKAEVKAQMQEAKNKENAKKPLVVTADYLLNRGFKRPTKEAVKQGKARLLMESIVNIAEKKLEEMRRKSEATTASNEVKAEHLAEELMHRPGSLLTEEEIAQIYEEVECQDSRHGVNCFERFTVNQFRAIDGTCNNLENPTWGASNTAFGRIFDSVFYEDGISRLRGQTQQGDEEEAFGPPVPSARLVSTTVVRDSNDTEDFTHLLMQFGQFLDHDLDLGPEFEGEECGEDCIESETCVPIRIEDDDEVFGRFRPQEGDCSPFRRSVPVCDPVPGRKFSKYPSREQINVLTSFIDGSMVYGSNEEQEEAVRAEKDGLLRVRDDTVEPIRQALPIDVINEEGEGRVACFFGAEDCFLCGDVRCNEQVSLTIMHTLWVREHNRIAKKLKSLNSDWDDETIYQEARKIVGAVIQKIVYYDYLPLIMGNTAFAKTIGPFVKYDPEIDPSVPNSFATAAYRYGHSLVQPQFERLDPRFNVAQPALDLFQMFFNPRLFDETDAGNQVMRGWLERNARKVDEFLNSVLTNQLFQVPREAAGTGMDLAALNVQRGRDHGLPVYQQWRDFCLNKFELGVPEFQSFLTAFRFQALYGNQDDIDLWPAGLAEKRLPDGLIGPTFACIFGITFQQVRDGDRFYFEVPGVFTRQQRNQIKKATFSSVICDNTDTAIIQPDAFRLSNGLNARKPCNEIPRMNLARWTDPNQCFVPVGIQNVPRTVRVRTRFPPSRARLREAFVVPTTHSCVRVPCPVDGSPYILKIFVKGRTCPFVASSFFPVDPRRNGRPENFRVYRRFTVTPSDLGVGVYDTIEACQNQNVEPIVSFACSAATTANKQATDDPPVPDEIQEDEKEEAAQSLANQEVLSQAAEMKEAAKVEQEVNDEQLTAELEELMKKLN